MNKSRFRIIFNRARGMLMAVAECVTGAGKSSKKSPRHNSKTTGSPAHPAPEHSTAVTLKPAHYAVLCRLGMVGLCLVTIEGMVSIGQAHADIIADTAAPANQRPMVVSAPNGVPLVNIQTPSEAGVSRNTYSQFDVNSNGAILNNSRTNVQTQLGGWVQGNPNLAAGTARIILNEVNSLNPSLLYGYVEVAGSRAQVVIANPAGISCNGCGFINAQRATLTTGTPILNGGDLIGYRVTGGAINFLGAGLDASQTDYTDIITRAVNINAGIWANNLNVFTGSNQISVNSSGDVTNIAAIAGAGASPTFAVDVAALGGMYAGKIHMIGTEAGVGVSNAGNIGASVGEVSIDVNGQLTNRNRIGSVTHTTINAGIISNTGGSIAAGQQLDVNAASLSGDGKLLSGGDANVNLASDYTHTATGELQANGNFTFTTTGNFTNHASIFAGNTLTLNAQNIQNTATGVISGLDTSVNVTGTLTNRGLIDGSDTYISADTLNNVGTGAIFGDHLAIEANTVINDAESANTLTTAAVMAARNRLDIGAANIINRDNSIIFSAGDMAIGGALDINHEATVAAGLTQASTLVNQGAIIEALGNLSLNVADLQNLNTGVTTQTVFVGTTAYDQFTPRGQGSIYDSGDYPLWQIGNFNMSWRYGADYNLPFNFREYWRYVYTGTTTQTQVASSNPGQILSGGDTTIRGNITNSDSKIIAGGTLSQTGGSLNNYNTQGQTTTTYAGTAYYYDYDGNESCSDPGDGCYDISASPYNPANSVTTFNLATTEFAQNTAVTGSGTGIATLNVNTLPNNSLFQPSPNPSSSYLIETAPRFANYRIWLSSDYMLNALSYDPATQTKRLGDGFYEQRLIREQIGQLTGRRFLEGYASDEAQYQALMNSGITVAQAFNLTPGIALTEAQIAQLTSDIVWLVAQTVTLPDGTVIQALVPQVYVRTQPGDISNSGSLLAGQNINLNLTADAAGSGNLVNSGTIAGRNIVAINADNLQNLGGDIQGRQVGLSATQDIVNQGGTIAAQDVLVLDAGHDISVESSTQNSNSQIGASNFSRTNLDRVAGLYITNPGGTGILVASAGNDINLAGAELINLATEGQTVINAGNDLKLGTITIAEQNNSIRNARNYVKHDSAQEIGTSIQTQGDITLAAGNDLTARAANITSEQGALIGVAGNNITVEAGEATSNMATARYVKKSGTLSSKKTTERDTYNDTTSIASNLSADSISLTAGHAPSAGEAEEKSADGAVGSINVKGSNVVATNNVDLNATGDVNITAAQETYDETHYQKVKKSGFSTTDTSVGYSKSKLTTTNDTQQVMNVGSTVGSVEGDVNINAGSISLGERAEGGGKVSITGSDVLTPQGDINISAQSVDINAATDTYANQQTMKYKQSGITIGVSNPVISAVQTADQMTQAASRTSDPRMQALAAGTTALATYNAADALGQVDQYGNVPIAGNTGPDDMTNVTEANAADKVGGINVSISIGTSKSKSSSSQTVNTAKSSTLDAGGDVNITATGAGKDSDINVIGSQIKAAHDVTLKADDEINLQAAQNTSQLQSKNKSSSASVGVSVNLGANAGVGITAGVSQGKGKANGSDTTWTETQVQSGNTTTLQSGTDTNLIGAQVIGNQVIANVGTSGSGNLNIESLQDTSSYDSKQKNVGISVTVPVTGTSWGGSVSASSSNINSDYASVNEQAGIFAGDGGFQVNVNGNTNLTGAVIASTEQAIQNNANSITTQTLTTSNIANSAAYEAEGLAVTVGTGEQAGLPQLSGLGVGHDAGDADSVTVSAISSGTLKVTDDAKQQALSGKTVDGTIATLNRDVHVNEQGQAVDNQGNSIANTINPIFDAEEVQNEIDVQVQITQAFDKAQQQFRLTINEKVDVLKAEKEAIANTLQNQDLSEEQRFDLINQGLNAQKEIEQLESMGRVFSAIAASLSAPTNNIAGIMANSLAPEAANQIGQYFKDHGTEGTAPHILAHGVLAGAVAALGGNNPMGAALSAMGGEITAPLLADFLYGKPSEELNAEQKATISSIARLGGLAAAASADTNVNNIAQANLSVQNAVDNNWGEVGHYSTMATVLYLAGFSSKDARAIALAAWGPDTDKRNAMSTNSLFPQNHNQEYIHLLDGEDDPTKVVLVQKELTEQVRQILLKMKQYENDPAKKAALLTTPDVQNILHAFGDSFAHVDEDGTHYPSGRGHAVDSKTGNDPDNPNIHADAYENYVKTLFGVASQMSVNSRVDDSTISNLINKVTTSVEEKQAAELNSIIGSVIKATPTNNLVTSPVRDCGHGSGCSKKSIGDQVNLQINSIYDIRK